MRVEADLHTDDSSYRVQPPGDDIYNLTVRGIWSFTSFYSSVCANSTACPSYHLPLCPALPLIGLQT